MTEPIRFLQPFRHKGYLGFTEQDESGVIRGRVAGIRDMVTFQGATPGEAAQAFRDSVDDYIEFCEQLGGAPEKPNTHESCGNVFADLGCENADELLAESERKIREMVDSSRTLVCGAFAKLLPRYEALPPKLRQGVFEMAAILEDPETDEQDQRMTVGTIWEALFGGDEPVRDKPDGDPPMSDETRAMVQRGIDQAKRGEMAPAPDLGADEDDRQEEWSPAMTPEAISALIKWLEDSIPDDARRLGHLIIHHADAVDACDSEWLDEIQAEVRTVIEEGQ